MFSRARLVLLLGAALGAPAARGDETSRGRLTDELGKARLELREVEEQLETLRRLVPADAGRADVLAFLQRAAERAELPSPVVASAAKSEAVVHDGRATGISLHRTLVSGRSAYAPLLAGAGLRVGPGPLRRVSATATPTSARLQEYTGQPVSVSLRHAALVDVLRLLEEITGLPMLVARGVDRKVSVFAREQPWDLVLDSVIAASGLSRDIADGRLYVGPETALQAPGRPGFVSVTEASTSGRRREWWTFGEGR